MYALRIGGGLIWLTILAYIFYPQRISWALFHLPSWMRWLGVLGGFAALLLLFWMFRSLGMNITDTVVTRNKHSLVTKRPYRWIRHPLYTFGGLVLLCLSLITTIWLIPMLAIPTFAILIRRTSIEEQALLERFGDEYRLYSENTGRFFPNIGIQTINSNRPDQI